jgi:hypothetical protein
MRHNPGWIGGLIGVAVVGGALLARSPQAPVYAASTAQVTPPVQAAVRGRPLFAPACSAVYRSDGCEMARRATWKA